MTAAVKPARRLAGETLFDGVDQLLLAVCALPIQLADLHELADDVRAGLTFQRRQRLARLHQAGRYRVRLRHVRRR